MRVLHLASIAVACFICLWMPHICTGKENHSKGGKTLTCGQTYNNTNGTITVQNSSSTVDFETNCKWTIVTPEENHTIMLVFDDAFLEPLDTVVIEADGKELTFFDSKVLSNVSGVFPVLTGKSNITVTLNVRIEKISIVRKFLMHYYSTSECSYTITNTASGTFRSPLYDHSNFVMPIDCSFKINAWNKKEDYLNVWLNQLTFRKGELTVSGSDIHSNHYTADNFPTVEFLTKDFLTINLTITNTSAEPDMFMVNFDSVSAGCSSGNSLKPGETLPLNVPNREKIRRILSTPQQHNLNCLWMLECAEGKTMTVTVKNVSLPQEIDQLLILDGGNRTAPVLMHTNKDDQQTVPLLYSSGNQLWMYASIQNLLQDFTIGIDVTETKSGGHFRDQAKVSIEEDSTFLLEVQPGKQVKLELEESHLESKSSVSFYKDYFVKTSKPFLTMTSDNMKTVIVSPSEKMAVVATGFAGSKLSGNFSGIEEGCYKYGQGSGDTYSVSGHCGNTCAWTIEPVPSKDLFSFHFQSLSLTKNDTVLIRMLDKTQTLVANVSSPTPFMPDLWIPTMNGALLQVIRENCTTNNSVIQASYQVTPSCEKTLSPGLRETVEISSPGYPNHYPLGAQCLWTVQKPNNSAFLHVSLKDLKLAKDSDVLEILLDDGKNGTRVFMGNGSVKDLPDDMPIVGNVWIKFTSHFESLETMTGFKLEVSAVESGQVLMNSTGKVETPGFPNNVTGPSLFVWLVQAISNEQQKQIVEFSFANGTNFSSVEQNLKIYDGASLRSAVVTNFTNETSLSRTNDLLFVYQINGSVVGPAFSVNYKDYPCNMSSLCLNGICMHEDWICNGHDDCGDFTDEMNCAGSGPPPSPPIPPPAPSPSENKGVSTTALAVGILVALVIGFALGAISPTVYRRIKGNHFRSYSSFTNNIE